MDGTVAYYSASRHGTLLLQLPHNTRETFMPFVVHDVAMDRANCTALFLPVGSKQQSILLTQSDKIKQRVRRKRLICGSNILAAAAAGAGAINNQTPTAITISSALHRQDRKD